MQITAKSLLASFIALLLVLTLSPFVAYADETVLESTPQEYDVEIGPTLDSTSDPQKENSYRFENGERITSEDGAATDTESILSTFSAVVNPEGYTVFNWFDKFSKGYYTGTNAYKGIDVSEHNGTINWKTVKASGVDYAIIRCGYGQNSKSQDDDQWINNVRGCINNGIPFGVYIYSYATNTTRAASEADHVLRCLKDAGLNPSKVGYPIYFDMEDASTIGSDYAAMATAFCDKIKAAGYVPGVYANKTWFNEKLTASCFDSWTKWVAEWNASKGLTYTGLSNFTSGNGMWQFSDYGTVPGINSKAVDLDYTFMKPKFNVAFASIRTSGMMRNVTGKALSPSITVKLDGKMLKAGTDYTISYKKQGTSSATTTAPSAAGVYEVTITGTGTYSGVRSLGNMTIYPKPNIDTSFACRLSSVANQSLLLDAAGASPQVGANISLWSNKNQNNQMWYIVPDGNGYYMVKSAAKQNLVLDATGSSPQNGANITAWTDKKQNNNNQKWILVESNGSFVFRNAANNSLALDATGSNPKIGANVTAWTSKNSDNQKWKISKMNDLAAAVVTPSGMVRNKTGQQLKVTTSTSLAGKQLKEGTDYTILYNGGTTPPTSTGNYSVSIKGKGAYTGTKTVGTMRIVDPPALSNSSRYNITSASNTRFILDAVGAKPALGANVSIWTKNGGDNQKWYFMPDGEGYYTIKSAANQDYVLDAAGANPALGANISVWSRKNNQLNQKWTIESDGKGSWVIRNAANSNLVLDAHGKTPSLGANVTAWSSNDGNNQKWKINAA